jgi:hypothetical protein
MTKEPRTGIKVGDDETLARHPTGLVHEHVGALVVRVVGDEEARRFGVVRVEGFDDLGGLRDQPCFTQLQQADMRGYFEAFKRHLPLILVRHTCPSTDGQLNATHTGESGLTIWCGSTSRSSGGIIDTASCLLKLPCSSINTRSFTALGEARCTHDLRLANEESL